MKKPDPPKSWLTAAKIYGLCAVGLLVGGVLFYNYWSEGPLQDTTTYKVDPGVGYVAEVQKRVKKPAPEPAFVANYSLADVKKAAPESDGTPSSPVVTKTKGGTDPITIPGTDGKRAYAPGTAKVRTDGTGIIEYKPKFADANAPHVNHLPNGEWYYPNAALQNYGHPDDNLEEMTSESDHLHRGTYPGQKTVGQAAPGKTPDDYKPFGIVRNYPHEKACGTPCNTDNDCGTGMFCCQSTAGDEICMDREYDTTGGKEMRGGIMLDAVAPACKAYEKEHPRRDVKFVYSGLQRDWMYYDMSKPKTDAAETGYIGEEFTGDA